VLALLARWCGFVAGAEVSAEELARKFDVERMPREQVVFTSSDDRWLIEGSHGRDARATSG
jgi:hypothetical protein